LRLIADLYLQRKTQATIGSRLGLTQSQISRDIKEIQRRWREAGIIDCNERKQQELARIDLIEQHAWAGWEQSCRDREVTTTSAESGGRGNRNKVQTRKNGQAGDPRFLERLGWCVEQRCKIFGLYARSDTVQVPVSIAQTNIFAGVPVEELERLERE